METAHPSDLSAPGGPFHRKESRPAQIIRGDSISDLAHGRAAGAVVISGSHGGRAAALFALRGRVKGALFNDAAIGKERAGVAGLDLLNDCGVLAAAVDAFTARIGVADETAGGVVSRVNRLASQAGVRAGMLGLEAAHLMAEAESLRVQDPGFAIALQATVVSCHASGARVVALDSNSMIEDEHRRDIVVTGSHGGLVGHRPAVGHPVLAAYYNDAGVGKDAAGISRLPWLQAHGIAGVAVSAHTARSGDGLDTYASGIVFHLNACTRDLGILPGMCASEAVRVALRGLNT